jgi:hypothetical protein
VRHDRHFTLIEARGELAWVAKHLAALRDAHARLTDEDTRHALAGGSAGNGGGAAGKKVGVAFLQIQAEVSAFDARGILLRDLDRGLVDFPSLRDGREIYLCWVDGEPDIAFWHELDDGYSGRQPI